MRQDRDKLLCRHGGVYIGTNRPINTTSHTGLGDAIAQVLRTYSRGSLEEQQPVENGGEDEEAFMNRTRSPYAVSESSPPISRLLASSNNEDPRAQQHGGFLG